MSDELELTTRSIPLSPEFAEVIERAKAARKRELEAIAADTGVPLEDLEAADAAAHAVSAHVMLHGSLELADVERIIEDHGAPSMLVAALLKGWSA